MSLAILFHFLCFHFLCAQNVSDINISIIRNLAILMFENEVHWRFEFKKITTTNRYYRLRIYLPTNKTLTHNSLYVFYS